MLSQEMTMIQEIQKIEDAEKSIIRNGGTISKSLIPGYQRTVIRLSSPGLKLLSKIDFLLNHQKGYVYIPY